MANPVIFYDDVILYAVEFATLDGDMVKAQLNILNQFADNLVQSPPFPNVAKQPGQKPPIYQAKLNVICHLLKLLNFNQEGMVVSDKVGDLASQYAVLADFTTEWDQTIYGRFYKMLRRIFAVGISVFPPPMAQNPLGTTGPNFG